MKRIAAVSILVLTSALAGCAETATPYSPPSSSSEAVAAWSHDLVHARLPSTGCFRASYPDVAWSRVACTTPVRPAIAPDVVGDGNDYSLVSLPYTMSAAIGSFPAVSGVTSVRSKGIPAFGSKGLSAPNTYSLQLNTNNFSTAACKGIAHCVGWVQFVDTNEPGINNTSLTIWYWLLSTTSKRLSGCPRHAGWEKAGGDCVQTAPYAVKVPNVPIADLQALSLSGAAGPNGDSSFLAVGATVYGMRHFQSDGITDLSQHWTGAQFNVFGDANGRRAMFNAGSTLTVRLEADTGTSTSPVCRGNAGTTAESSNLSFIAAPADLHPYHYPSIVFNESNAGGGGSASCDALAGS
jgi:hypothetical protein